MINKIIRAVITILQVLIAASSLILQYLSDKKMGVMRYLAYKNMVFPKETFTPPVMFIIKVFLITGIIICILLLAIKSKRKENRKFTKILINALILNIISAVFILSKFFVNFAAYYFILISLIAVTIFQFIKVIMSIKK